MPVSIPLKSSPNQIVHVTLGGQYCKIQVTQKSTGLFFSLWKSDAIIVSFRLAHDRTWLVRSGYLGFSGDLTFVDTVEKKDPVYDQLGVRYKLVYMTAEEVAANG